MPNHSILVTGASSGIGLSCVQLLASQNWRVFAGARKQTDLDRLQSLSVNITPLPLDVMDPSSIENAVKVIGETVGAAGLSGLINNAGVGAGGPLEFLPPDQLNATLQTNTVGPFLVTQKFIPLLRLHAEKFNDARVINISSVSGLVSFPFVGPYAASKFALNALTEAWRQELAPARIYFSLIEPGPIKTPIWGKTRERMNGSDRLNEIEARYPGYQKMSAKMLGNSEQSAIDPLLVAQLVLKTLTVAKPRLHYPIGPGSLFARLRKFIPESIWEFLVQRELKKMRGKGL